MQESINVFHIPFEELFQKIKDQIPIYSYDYEKHIVKMEDDLGESIGFLRLPLHLSIDNELNIINTDNQILYLSIESGYAAICLMKGKKNIYHSTFTAYMTRKKQGFSQIKYLNKKGKSRAGSRVRLAATTEFFENINKSSTELLKKYVMSRIALNCNSTLIPFLFNSKIPPPFEKNDSILYKIPLHIPKSNYTNLSSAIKKLMAPIIFYKSDYKLDIENLIKEQI